jgi:predicted phosphodiesterase
VCVDTAPYRTQSLSVRIAVISDLHLGSGGPADTFGHRDENFARFLTFLEQNFERIVLLGDIWETLTTLKPFSPLAGLLSARRAHPRLAERFTLPQYSYIQGNHDLISGSLGAPEEVVIEADGHRILLTHGHHYDLIVQRARWFPELGVWLGGWLRRLRLSPIYRAFDKLDGLRNGPIHDSARCTFQRWATTLARARGANVVVTGHTHHAIRAEHGDQLFLNSGSCSNGRFSFLSLDTRRGEFGVNSGW